jgi:hypothetical protein
LGIGNHDQQNKLRRDEERKRFHNVFQGCTGESAMETSFKAFDSLIWLARRALQA